MSTSSQLPNTPPPGDSPAAAARLSRPELWLLVGLVLLSGLLLGLMNNRFLTLVNLDSAIFCLLGKSLLQGQGYLLTSLPEPQPYFTFPPMLALQLAGLMWLFHNTDLAAMQAVFKGYIHLLFLGSIPLFYLWLRNKLEPRWGAMALTALLALNPLMMKFSADILSDVPYWAFVMAAIFFADRWAQARESGRSAWGAFGGMLAFAVTAILTRQIGMALALALLGWLAILCGKSLGKQWKPLAVATVVLGAAVLFWPLQEHLYRSAHPQMVQDTLNQAGVTEVLKKSPIKLEYVKHFLVVNPVSNDAMRVRKSPLDLLQMAALRTQQYSQITVDQILPPLSLRLSGGKVNVFHTGPFWLGTLALFMTGLWQACRGGRKRFLLPALYTGLTMGVLLVYPYVSPRFVVPVFPFILLFVVLGFQTALAGLAAWRPTPPIKWLTATALPVFLILTLAGGHLPQTIRWVNHGFQIKRADAGPSKKASNNGFYHTLLWVKANTPADSLVISRKPPVTYFYAERKSLGFPFTANVDEMDRFIRDKQAAYQARYSHVYLVEDTAFSESIRYLTPAVAALSRHWSLVYTEPRTGSRVWRLR